MRLAAIILIARKETLDLLRDRRTVALIFLAPLVLYPFFGAIAWIFATELVGKPANIGVVNAADAEAIAGEKAHPPLLANGQFPQAIAANPDAKAPEIVPNAVPLDGDPEDALRKKLVDAVLIVPAGFSADVEAGKKPTLKLLYREGDDKSKIALARLSEVVKAWERQAKAVRFERDGKPKDYDQIIAVDDPRSSKPIEKKAADELRGTFARAFPMILILWLVAGTIQPAVDATAGEKERGTMETLLIAPVERGDIVLGKFFAVTAFALASVVWNVICLGIAASLASLALGSAIVSSVGLIACLAFGVPTAMLFGAVSIALGVFARSTKEGQYYLVPMMLIAMPMAFWTMLPTAELTPLTAMVPMVGSMLVQQRLLAVDGEPVAWYYWPLVLVVQFACVGIALWLAGWQFRRESVLFRDVGPARGRNG